MEYMRSMPNYTEHDMLRLFLYPDGKNHDLNHKNKKRKKCSVEGGSEGYISQKKTKFTNEVLEFTEDIKPIVLSENSEELRSVEETFNGFNLSITKISRQHLSQPGSGEKEQEKYAELSNKFNINLLSMQILLQRWRRA